MIAKFPCPDRLPSIAVAALCLVFLSHAPVWGQAAPVKEPAPAVAVPAKPLPESLQPYRVRVELYSAASLGWEASELESIAGQVADILRSRFRQSWELAVQPGEAASILSAWKLSQLSDESATARVTGFTGDKVFWLTCEQQGSVTRWTCREWDAATRTISGAATMESRDPRQSSQLAADAVCAVFRPLVRLDSLTDKTGDFLIRAGEFPPRSPEQMLLSSGDYLVPFLRHLDREQKVRRIQSLPWTYLKVDDVDRGRMHASIVSAFPGPIPAARRRMDVVALRVRPTFSETRLLTFPRRDPLSPLAGVRCAVYDDAPPKDSTQAPQLNLVTDRAGVVAVPVDPQHLLRYFEIHSGTALLARVPLIPGVAAEMSLDVPDDRARLLVEGEAELLKGELIEIVATREVLMARIRGTADQAKWADVDKMLVELGKLPTVEQYHAEVDAIQVQAVYQAQQARDRVAEARIKKLCAGVKDSASKHLDPFRINEFRREMQLLRRNK